MRSAARVGAGNDFGWRAGAMAESHEHAAAEARVISIKLAKKRGILDLVVGIDQGELGAIDHLDVGSSSRARGHDDIAHAIAVDIADGHAHAAREPGGKGIKTGLERARA